MFQIFNVIFTYPITNLLVAFYQLFTHFGVPYAFGFSIILLTAVVKLFLFPFMSAQIKSTYKMQKVAPLINSLKEKHKGDNKRQQEEIMKLYKEHGVNPAGGCIPLLVQIPIIYSLYHVLITAVNANTTQEINAINKVLYFDWLKIQSIWNLTFFGLPLGANPWELAKHGSYLMLLIPLITGLGQFVLSKMMMPEEVVDAKIKLAKQTPQKEDDFQAAFQKQSMFIFPAMIGLFSATLPIGLSLYWNTFTVFGILQQYILVGAGSLTPHVNKLKGKVNGNK
ncbi:MAG TPA: YidC/Oxa1 family membrane protein insertase [Patescibacteria group bacterium]|nr:YidC/Oxa1 family membrane protein insertase [Patescibacteria group bacterium]